MQVCRLLDLAIAIMKFQCEHDNFYIVEHPLNALSWQRLSRRNVPGSKLSIDMCMVGLTAPNGLFMKKATGVQSSIPGLAARFEGLLCTGKHAHEEIQSSQGIKLSILASQYPEKFCTLIADAAIEIYKTDVEVTLSLAFYFLDSM